MIKFSKADHYPHRKIQDFLQPFFLRFVTASPNRGAVPDVGNHERFNQETARAGRDFASHPPDTNDNDIAFLDNGGDVRFPGQVGIDANSQHLNTL